MLFVRRRNQIKNHILCSVVTLSSTRNLSMSELSLKAGLAPNYICSTIEDYFNWNPKVDTLLNIIAALSVSPSDVIRLSRELSDCTPLTKCKRIKTEVIIGREIRNRDIYTILKRYGVPIRSVLPDFRKSETKNPRTTFYTLCHVAEVTGCPIEEILESLHWEIQTTSTV